VTLRELFDAVDGQVEFVSIQHPDCLLELRIGYRWYGLLVVADRQLGYDTYSIQTLQGLPLVVDMVDPTVIKVSPRPEDIYPG
jgi:nitric oxide synthase oxygenase domain/subunit